MSGNRLAKVMARHGLCSRRQAEQWIVDGRVRVNQKFIRTPAFNVIDTDKIEVDGTLIAERKGTRVWLYHKPVGLVVTENDPEGRPTIFEELARRGLPRVLTVGRLDINTEGLLLLTNDGGLKRTLELPATGWLRRYRVRAHGSVTQEQLDKLKRGVTISGVRYGPIQATLERQQGANVWLLVALSEGKNREIKNVLADIGLQVNRLIRTSFGPFQLGDIPVGGLDTVKARVLQDQLGRKLAKQAGVDFEAPMPDPLAAAPAQRRGKGPRSRAIAAPRENDNSSDDDKSSARNANPRSKANPKPMGFKGRGRQQDERSKDFKTDEVENLRKVHFTGGRSSEMFEPQAERKSDERAGGGKGFKGGKKPFAGAGKPGKSDKSGKFGKKPFSSDNKSGGRKGPQRSERSPRQR